MRPEGDVPNGLCLKCAYQSVVLFSALGTYLEMLGNPRKLGRRIRRVDRFEDTRNALKEILAVDPIGLGSEDKPQQGLKLIAQSAH